MCNNYTEFLHGVVDDYQYEDESCEHDNGITHMGNSLSIIDASAEHIGIYTCKITTISGQVCTADIYFFPQAKGITRSEEQVHYPDEQTGFWGFDCEIQVIYDFASLTYYFPMCDFGCRRVVIMWFNYKQLYFHGIKPDPSNDAK